MHPLRKYGALAFCLLILVHVACKSTKTSEIVKEQEIISSKSLLWKIEGNKLEQPSYLFGTIHIIPANDYFLPEGTLSAIDKSKAVMFELDMNEMSDISKLMPLMQMAFMKDDLSLKDLLTTEEYGLVKTHFDKKGLPLFMLERIKPMFLTVFASADFDPDDLKTGEAKSYEFEFTEMANSAGKPISGLETIEYQIKVFDDIPYQDQAKMLVEAIKTSDMTDGSFQKMIDQYKLQDVEGLYRLIQGDEQIASHEDALLTKRNQNWIPIMKEKMSQEPIFFAVGAGHLGGPNGVISLLKKEGYIVSPYKG